ncbi:hypothetical protein F0562_025013 [Nyssa sinensis]|uniref:Uncharacterized protein n=1 Tax=Nyssa sinensis TaxID=561372 RepID=A0A5J5BFK3_9ASTE|nr:hypothetical protein F0562_025013 [Nyssa sinensis]
MLKRAELGWDTGLGRRATNQYNGPRNNLGNRSGEADDEADESGKAKAQQSRRDWQKGGQNRRWNGEKKEKVRWGDGSCESDKTEESFVSGTVVGDSATVESDNRVMEEEGMNCSNSQRRGYDACNDDNWVLRSAGYKEDLLEDVRSYIPETEEMKIPRAEEVARGMAAVRNQEEEGLPYKCCLQTLKWVGVTSEMTWGLVTSWWNMWAARRRCHCIVTHWL